MHSPSARPWKHACVRACVRVRRSIDPSLFLWFVWLPRSVFHAGSAQKSKSHLILRLCSFLSSSTMGFLTVAWSGKQSQWCVCTPYLEGEIDFFPEGMNCFCFRTYSKKENYSIYRRNGTGREFAYPGSELGLSFRPHDFFWSIFKGKEHRRSFNVGRRRAMIANHDLTHTMKFAKEHLLTKSRDVNSLHTCTVLACSTLKFNILVIKPWKQIKA